MDIKMLDLPAAERPRERWYEVGPHALQTSELMGILLGTGNTREHAVALSARVLAECGGLTGLAGLPLERLTAVNGIGPAKAMRLLAAIELGRRAARGTRDRLPVRVKGPQDVYDLLEPELSGLQKEHFVCLFLNTKNVVTGKETLSIGTLDATLVHPREVFKAAVQRSASSVICVHNHPSGDPAPSREDVVMTGRLIEAGELMGITVLDHVIIGDGRYASLKELGLIRPALAT